MRIQNSFFTCVLCLLGLSGSLQAAGSASMIDRQPPSLQLQLLDEMGTYRLTVVNEQISWEGKLVIRPDEPFCKELEAGFSFCGRLAKDGEAFHGYFQSGILQYSFRLQKDESGKLVGAWQNLVGNEVPWAKEALVDPARLVSYSIPY